MGYQFVKNATWDFGLYWWSLIYILKKKYWPLAFILLQINLHYLNVNFQMFWFTFFSLNAFSFRKIEASQIFISWLF